MQKYLIIQSSIEHNPPQFKHNRKEHKIKIKSKVTSLKNTEAQIVIHNNKLFNRNLTKSEYKVLKNELKDLYNQRSKLEKEIFWCFFEEE